MSFVVCGMIRLACRAFGSRGRAKNPQVSIPKDALAAFCREHGVRRLSIFGSALREAVSFARGRQVQMVPHHMRCTP